MQLKLHLELISIPYNFTSTPPFCMFVFPYYPHGAANIFLTFSSNKYYLNSPIIAT